MERSSFSKKRMIHLGIVLFMLIMIILISIFLVLKYTVEGEKNLPFNLEKINIVSTAGLEVKNSEENIWKEDILQKNDVSFLIKKNAEFKKEDAIKKISFANFNVIKTNENMIVNIYRPTINVNSYNYSDEYKIIDLLTYQGGQATNTETLQINNQGGIIGFSVVSSNLGEYEIPKNEKIQSDGRLISKIGMALEDIKFTISFDLIIETESEHKFSTNIVLDLPTGNILEEGIGTLENTDVKDIVFKRI